MKNKEVLHSIFIQGLFPWAAQNNWQNQKQTFTKFSRTLAEALVQDCKTSDITTIQALSIKKVDKNSLLNEGFHVSLQYTGKLSEMILKTLWKYGVLTLKRGRGVSLDEEMTETQTWSTFDGGYIAFQSCPPSLWPLLRQIHGSCSLWLALENSFLPFYNNSSVSLCPGDWLNGVSTGFF